MAHKAKSSPTVFNRMSTEIVKARHDSTVKDIIGILSKKGKQFEMLEYVYIIDEADSLIGVISLAEIFSSAKKTPIKEIMKKEIITISPDAKEEEVAHLALKHGLKAVPVVERGKLVGAVPAKTIMSILNKSLRKDILHFAGIHKSHLKYEDSMKVPFFLSIAHRIPWLIIGLIGIMVTAGFLKTFESFLQEHLILVFFIPAIVYISDALGTQVQTLFIRDIAVLGKELNMAGYFLRQMLIAGFMGLLLSGATLLFIFLLWSQLFIGFVIAVSMLIALIVNGFTALSITLILHKAGQDPALGGGPFATVVSDVTSVIIYFVVASLLL